MDLARTILLQDLQNTNGLSVLHTLKAVLDVTRSTTLRQHASSTPLGMLVGQPIAVIRAPLRLLVEKPPAGMDKVAVRLGDPADPEDGLLAWARTSDLSSLSCIHPEIYKVAFRFGGDKELHPYISKSQPQISIPITGAVNGPAEDLLLLVVPGRSVSVLSSLLPRERFQPAWSTLLDSLKQYFPSFRVGPVLGGANRVALPTPEEMVWKWKDRQPGREIPVSKPNGTLPEQPLCVTNGWIVGEAPNE